ncbi:MAG TPA: hypothetical protein VF251_14735, partial [Pyrinomonadaceae bacterium]
IGSGANDGVAVVEWVGWFVQAEATKAVSIFHAKALRKTPRHQKKILCAFCCFGFAPLRETCSA